MTIETIGLWILVIFGFFIPVCYLFYALFSFFRAIISVIWTAIMVLYNLVLGIFSLFIPKKRKLDNE